MTPQTVLPALLLTALTTTLWAASTAAASGAPVVDAVSGLAATMCILACLWLLFGRAPLPGRFLGACAVLIILTLTASPNARIYLQLALALSALWPMRWLGMRWASVQCSTSDVAGAKRFSIGELLAWTSAMAFVFHCAAEGTRSVGGGELLQNVALFGGCALALLGVASAEFRGVAISCAVAIVILLAVGTLTSDPLRVQVVVSKFGYGIGASLVAGAVLRVSGHRLTRVTSEEIAAASMVSSDAGALRLFNGG